MITNSDIKNSYKFKIVTAILFVSGVFLVAALIYYNETFSFQTFFRELIQIGWLYFSLITGISFFFFFLIAKRWSMLVTNLSGNQDLPFSFFMFYSCMSVVAVLFINPLLGNVGVKMMSLRLKKDVNLLKASTPGLTEHVLNSLILLIGLPSSCLYLFKVANGLTAFVILAVLSLIAMILIFFYMELVIRVLHSTFCWLRERVWCKRSFSQARQVPESLFDTNRSKDAAILFLYSFLIFYSALFRHYAYALALDIHISLPAFILAFPLMYIVAAAGITPGAIGTTEVGWFGILLLLGADNSQATTYVLAQRVLNITTTLLIVPFAWCYYYLFPIKKLERQ